MVSRTPALTTRARGPATSTSRSPAGYGLGKSGWVAARFTDGGHVPVDMLKAWIDESYRAQAPKKLVASLPAKPAAARKTRTRPKR